MNLIFKVLLMGLLQLPVVRPYKRYYYYQHPMERYHNPKLFTSTLNPVVDKGTDTKRPETRWSPDFRLEEPMPEPWSHYYIETHRPYRMSPFGKMYWGFPRRDRAANYGCYCTTVYKRFRLLAGCAVITTRHILTTATSTELVLQRYRKFRSLENILGAWYDVFTYNYNTSMYATPSRIHYHPLFTMPQHVNRSHPFSVMFDLAVWAATYRFDRSNSASICQRAAPFKSAYISSTPAEPAHYNIFGFQFMRAYSRRPMPWFKYTVRVPAADAIIPCPKTEWGWYHCFKIETWAPLGIDNGAALNRGVRDSPYDGLLGISVLSMKLRSVQMLSYFIDLNNHVVMKFFYNAYNGKIKYTYLDIRFEDSFNMAPLVKKPYVVPVIYARPEERYSDVNCCIPQKYRPGYQ